MSMPEVPRTYYWGRKWDAPLTDTAWEMPEAWVGGTCQACSEPLTVEDNLLYLPFMHGHLECILRQGMGDVAHLEGRCACSGGEGDHDKYKTYRESSKAALNWLLDNDKGRFHD